MHVEKLQYSREACEIIERNQIATCAFSKQAHSISTTTSTTHVILCEKNGC